MTGRKHISQITQAEVLVQSRRRCCVCFGLHRDEGVKKGQIAHLDGDRTNNKPQNLAFLCFDHHDELDSKTSQSKGLTGREVAEYREELHYHFGNWSARVDRDGLLNFLGFALDLDALAASAIKAASLATCFGAQLASEVLTQDAYDSCDADLYLPYWNTLDHYASWGWLTYEYEELKVPEEMDRVFFTVNRNPVCDEVARRIRYGESNA
jgi:hypothetical protein